MTHSGIDPTDLDPATRPQDDLYRHVNGLWSDAHVIPADRAMDGSFRELYDQAEEQVRDIITASSTGQIADLYASFMDTDAVEAAGAAPLAPELDLIRSATDHQDLIDVLGALQRAGAVAAAGFFVDTDADDPTRYVVHLTQSGLGLPDESYYREEQHAAVLAAYRPHIARMLLLGGWAADQADAEQQAGAVLALETGLAAGHWDVVKDRDADLTHNPTTLAGLSDAAAGFDWPRWIRALHAPEGSFDQLIVRQPSYLAELAARWTVEPVSAWQSWMAYHTISDRAPYLSSELVEANFDFYGRTLTGAQELRDRWKRGVSLVQGVLGEAVGKVYVERHFPPAHKQRMEQLVANLVEAYRESISSLPWMSEQTRERALAKLDAFTPKIGYPAKWRDYSALEIDAHDLLGNIRRAAAFEQDYELGKIGRPIDRDEWFMTPQTVNAYYNPGMNEIVFPAAILQPPFFDADADDAVNYGGIGAVIGHEIGHGFDDQGSKYDGEGRLHDWWTDQDRTEFEQRTAALIEQYNGFSPRQLDGSHHVNGALTIGENIGDLGGLSIALKAYRIALGGSLDDAPVIDGRTGVQRVFLGWARVWRTKGRDEEVIRRLSTDPHSPDEIRCNAVVRNIDEFYAAFDVQPGDGLYLAPEQRVTIW